MFQLATCVQMPILRSLCRRIPRGSFQRHPLIRLSTSVRWGSALPARSSEFASVTKDDVNNLRELLGSQRSLVSTLDDSATVDDLALFNNDWMNKYHGKSQVVLRPQTTQEVSSILRYCNEHNIAVVPQGGNTGLVGGSVPIHDEVVLSLSSLNQVRSFDPVSGILVADAGLILETADSYLADRGFIFPLDLGAKGSCHIGGNVATNAGGLRLIRYGSLHGSVLGLEVVLPDGAIWNGLRTLRKDNTGLDLKQLFIGSEGTIGIITAVSILCPRRPESMKVAVFASPTFEDVQKVLADAKTYLGETLSAFEVWDKHSHGYVQTHHSQFGGEQKLFDTESDYYCLIEIGGSNAAHDEEKLHNLLEHLMESGSVADGVVSQDSQQFARLWSLRELIPESCSKAGAAYKYDLSIPVSEMYAVVEEMREHLRSQGLLTGDGQPGDRIRGVAGFGHMGDGNLHLNVIADSFSDGIQKVIEPFVYEIVAKRDGSVSAEHGLGVMKAPYIGYSQTDTSIDLMRRVKTMFDPKGIMNPYKFVL